MAEGPVEKKSGVAWSTLVETLFSEGSDTAMKTEAMNFLGALAHEHGDPEAARAWWTRLVTKALSTESAH